MLTLTPINLKTANAFVQQYHRHHKPTRGHKFSIGVSDSGSLVGVAICGRPVARRLDDGYTLEINRLCTDGTPNACSISMLPHTGRQGQWAIQRLSLIFWTPKAAYRSKQPDMFVRAVLEDWNGTARESRRWRTSIRIR